MAAAGSQPLGGDETVTCYGMLFYSSTRWQAGKLPRCIGGKTGPRTDMPASHSPESLPGGDFKYLCAGCSHYSPTRYQQLRAEAKSSADSVELPLCEGVEVISAAEFHPGAVPLGSQSSPDEAAAPRGSTDTAQPQPGRIFDERSGMWGPWQSPGSLDLGSFLEKLQKNAEKVGTQLVKNVGLIGSSLYSAAQRTSEEFRRRGGQ